LGKTVYLVVETDDMPANEQLSVSVRSRGDVLGAGDLQLMYFNANNAQPPYTVTNVFAVDNVFQAEVGNADALNNNQNAAAAYTNLDDVRTHKAIIKLQLHPNDRPTFNRWAEAIGAGTANLEIVVRRNSGELAYYGRSDEATIEGTFLNERDRSAFTINNRNFYEIYHGENAYNFLTMNGNTRIKVGELRSYYTNGTREVSITTNTNYYFYDENDNEVLIVDNLQRNAHGLVLFPANGEGFGRYGVIDAGGYCPTYRETAGAGDHYLLPKVAAALFSITREVFSRGWRVDFGDMSSENGSDPWQQGFDHHRGHGHLGNRIGFDVDLHYLNRNGISFQAANNERTSPNFDRNNNTTLFQIASDYGFRNNQMDNRGHYDHGHWGFDINFVHIII